MKKMIAMMVLSMSLVGCGFQGDKGDQGAPGAPGPTGPTAPTPTPPVVDEVQVDIDALLKDENDYRLGLGQTMLSAGLSCSVAEISNAGQCLTSTGCAATVISTSGKPTYTYLYKGAFNQADSLGSNATMLLPPSLRAMYTGKNFKISCSGVIVVRETNYYEFSLNSDDGSILTVDGTQVVNNDGNHAMTLKTGSKFLRRGVRSFSLQYAQSGGGNHGLSLKAGGASIDGRLYAH